MDPADLKTNFNCIGAPLELQDKIMRGRRETRLEYLWSEKTRHRLMIEDTFDDKNIYINVLDINIDRKYILLLLTNLNVIIRGKPKLSRYLLGYNKSHWFLEIVPETESVSNIEEALAIVAVSKMRIRMSEIGYF